MTRYRVLTWDGIPAEFCVFEADDRRRSVALDPWFIKQIDHIAMERGIFGSKAYFDLWRWSEDRELPGTGDDVVTAVRAKIESQWAGRRSLYMPPAPPLER